MPGSKCFLIIGFPATPAVLNMSTFRSSRHLDKLSAISPSDTQVTERDYDIEKQRQRYRQRELERETRKQTDRVTELV